MAYQQNPDGPVVDKGAFRARIFEVLGIIFFSIIIVSVILKLSNPEQDTKKLTNQEKLDLFKKDMADIFVQSPIQYSIQDSDGVVTIKTWQSGLVEDAKKAANGDRKALEGWETMKESIKATADSIYENLLLRDIPGAKVVLRVVNETNHDLSLLVYANGQLTYDVVRDTKGD